MNFSPEEILIFLGPSLDLKLAQSILPALYFPPAKQGDIISLSVQFQPKVIGLIDGTFSQTLSVWHKEILYALKLGITVLGASSMGALRAAETAPFGMIGIGKIFELYRDSIVNDDDEVALIHGPKEEGYLALALPLINMRFTLDFAVQERKIPKSLSLELIEIARSIYYPNRSIESIADEAKKKGISQANIETFKELMTTQYIDQKKIDALLLLEKIKTLSPSDAEKKANFVSTSLFEMLYHYDRRTYFSSTELSSRQIANYVALHHPDFSEIQFSALNQALAEILSKFFKVEVSEEEKNKEKERFCLRLQLANEQELSQWIVDNHLTVEDFDKFMTERSKARKMHRYFFGGHIPWKQIKFLLAELRWSNEYSQWAEKARCQEELLQHATPYYSNSDIAGLYDEDLIETHLKESKCRPDLPFDEWAIEAGFQNIWDLRSEMHKAKLARRTIQTLF